MGPSKSAPAFWVRAGEDCGLQQGIMGGVGLRIPKQNLRLRYWLQAEG